MAHVSPVERPGKGSSAGAAVRSGKGMAVLGRCPGIPEACPLLARKGALGTSLRPSVPPPGDRGGPPGGLLSPPQGPLVAPA